ncbi:DNase I-like protein [Amanita muscaria]
MLERKSLGSAKLLPPPTRTIALGDKLPPARRPGGGTGDSSDDESGEDATAVEDTKFLGGDSFPDSSRSSRRPPIAAPFRAGQFALPKILINAYGGHYVVAGSLVAVGHSYTIKVYDLSVFDSPMYVVDTKDLGKITCMELKSTGEGEARLMWVGTKEGQVFEVDLRTGAICSTKQVTNLHPVTHVLRHGRAMVTLDEGGKALVFTEGEGNRGVSLTGTQPRVLRVTEKQDFVRMLGGKLWTAARTDHNGVGGAVSSRLPIIRVYDLFSPGSTGKSIVPTEHVGAVTSATMIPSHKGKVYVGHEEGFVSIWAVEGTEDGYPKCLEVVKVSASDVMCVEGVNDRLWIGSRNGMISAYDVAARPWVVTNSWSAHPGLPVLKLSVDVFGIDEGRLSVMSVGRDDVMRFWDGLLGMDWMQDELQRREDSYSKFRDVTALFFSWNCDAARPDSLTGDPANVNLFSDILNSVDEPPDIIVFGFQEVIDLESRKMAAKNVLLGGASKKKHHDEGVTGIACSGNGLSDKVTGAYRRWYERLVKEVRSAMPQMPYTVVHTESLVGLFSCVFIKATERFLLRDVAVTSVKRGMGGRYGNKGAIVARFILGDSSICMVNCHLAAGQNAVRRRNADFAAILEEKSVFPPTEHPMAYGGGGDGTMILDHEIVFVNGDMNYRIDHRREAIISSIRAGEFANILAHDQLLREIKFNRGCRFRGFSEGPITFAPTYKYDPRSNEYDTSEKRRLPAWCDRVLWRSRDPSRVQQLHYRRYEANVSDHRPISAAFKITVKTIEHDVRMQALKHVRTLWEEEQAQMLAQARVAYFKENDM